MIKVNNKAIIIVFISLVLALAGLLVKQAVSNNNLQSLLAEEVAKNDPGRLSDHQREVWLAVLEWCESRGIPNAINLNDSDNTPSFGAFSFKPDTFREYSLKYKIAGNLMDYDAQLAILKQMLNDPTVKWAEKEFPGCIKKIGLPPKKF